MTEVNFEFPIQPPPPTSWHYDHYNWPLIYIDRCLWCVYVCARAHMHAAHMCLIHQNQIHYVALAGLEILLLLLPKVLRLKAATMSGLTSLKQGKVTDPDINYQGVTVTMSRTEQEDQRGRGTQG